jgi:hypothetical protein
VEKQVGNMGSASSGEGQHVPLRPDVDTLWCAGRCCVPICWVSLVLVCIPVLWGRVIQARHHP